MPLFEVAILEVKKKKEKSEDGEEITTKERLVFGPKCLIAKDPQTATVVAVMDNPGDLNGIDREKMQILVRPFA